MTRSEHLPAYLRTAFGEVVLFVDTPPNDAGFHFEEWGTWRFVVCVEQVVTMAEALTDEQFVLFLSGFSELARNVLTVIEDDVDQAVFDAQHLTATAMPEAYMLVDSVFSVE